MFLLKIFISSTKSWVDLQEFYRPRDQARHRIFDEIIFFHSSLYGDSAKYEKIQVNNLLNTRSSEDL